MKGPFNEIASSGAKNTMRSSAAFLLFQQLFTVRNPHILPCPRLMVWRITGAVT
jgi:hypothetical protein